MERYLRKQSYQNENQNHKNRYKKVSSSILMASPQTPQPSEWEEEFEKLYSSGWKGDKVGMIKSFIRTFLSQSCQEGVTEGTKTAINNEEVDELIQEMKEYIAFLKGFNDRIKEISTSPYYNFLRNHRINY